VRRQAKISEWKLAVAIAWLLAAYQWEGNPRAWEREEKAEVPTASLSRNSGVRTAFIRLATRHS